MKLAFGLNIKKNPKPSKTITTTLESLSDSEPDLLPQGLGLGLGLQKKRVNQALTATHDLAESVTNSAPASHLYDDLYDNLQAQKSAKKKRLDNDDGSGVKKPRYMKNLIEAARIRKSYMENVQAKKMLLENEGESEVFVTEAYLEKQKMESALAKDENENDFDPAKPRDTVGFYGKLLEAKTRTRNYDESQLTNPNPNPNPNLKPIVLGAAFHDDRDETQIDGNIEARTREKVDEYKARKVLLNDNEQVVDKRELLSGGLNLTAKSHGKRLHSSGQGEGKGKREDEMERVNRIYRQEKTQRQIEAQKAEIDRQAVESKEKRIKTLVDKVVTTNVDKTAISDARARYLKRKGLSS